MTKRKPYTPLGKLMALGFKTGDSILAGNGAHVFMVLEDRGEYRSILSVEFGNELITIGNYKFDWARKQCSKFYYAVDFEIASDNELMFLLHHLPAYIHISNMRANPNGGNELLQSVFKLKEITHQERSRYQPYKWSIGRRPSKNDSNRHVSDKNEIQAPPSFIEKVKAFFTT